MADIVYSAQLNNQQVLQALQAIDKNIDKIANDASKKFDNIGKSASVSGVQIGAISGIVSSLTTELINLGKAGVDALVSIGQQSVQTAIEMDTLKARLGGIFDGSQEAADQAFGFIQKKSKELGIDLSELAGAFIPKTENLAQFERVAKVATALARSDPEQGAIGARIALIEALSGTFTSLQRRFEVPKDDINRIKEAFDTDGIEGFLTTLETVLAESGKSFEDFTGTAQTSFDRLGIAGEQLGGRLGQPIVEALQQASEKILGFINENEDDLIIFADTIGRAIGEAIEFISSIDFSNLDTTTLIEIGNYIFRIVETSQLAATQILNFIQSFSQLPGVAQTIDALAYGIKNLDDALLTLSQILTLGNASLAALEASTNKAQIAFLGLSAAVKASRGDLLGAYEDVKKAGEALATNSDAQQAYTDSILASNAQFEEYYQSLKDNAQAQDDLKTTLNETANAGTGAADAILGLKQANAQAAEDADKLADAQTKVNEKMAEAQQDFSRKLEDIDIETERKRLDIQIEFAQKREDAAKKNVQKLEDIQTKYQQDVTDAAKDLERKEEDIARKYGQERIDLERDQRQKRVDIETEFRRTLQDIQSQFLIDADEAEKNRDAISFLRAIKERDQKVQEAQKSREQSINDARVEGERRREELQIQREREIEEARIANERKLEDLRTNLERQIEAQNTAYERELEDLSTAEQRKNEELNRNRERDIEDAKRSYERKLEDLRASLEEELALIEEFADKKAAAEAKGNSSTSTTGSPKANKTTKGGGKPKGAQQTTVGTPFAGFAKGGKFKVGGSGGTDSQLVQFMATPGEQVSIVPKSGLMLNTAGNATGVTQNSYSNNQTVNLPMATAGQLLDPIMVATIRNIIGVELARVN